MSSKIAFEIDQNKIESIKDLHRRLWEYQPVDHIPVHIELWPSRGYSRRERCEIAEVEFECNVSAIRRSLKVIPDDFIPATKVVWGSFATIATMFGTPLHWSEDPNQWPGLGNRLINDIQQVYELHRPNPNEDGLMPEILQRLRMFAERLPTDIYIAGPDLEGPLANAFSIMDEQLFYLGLAKYPKEMHHILNLVTEVQLACYDEVVRVVGDANRLTCTDWSSVWQPEGRKGYVNDDVCANISPIMFETYSKPYNNRIYQRFGGGILHNCGPNPSTRFYLQHDPSIKGLSCSSQFSKKDLDILREAFAGQGIIQLLMYVELTPQQMLEEYTYFMNKLVPDVVAIPICRLDDDDLTDSEITDFYWEMRKISNDYARNMRWERH